MYKPFGTIPVAHPERLYDGEGILTLTDLLSKEELKGAGRRVGIMTLPPNTSIGFHKHNGEFEAYYVISGLGKYLDNDQEYLIKPGDFTLCKDGDSHGVLNAGEEELRLFIVILNTIPE